MNVSTDNLKKSQLTAGFFVLSSRLFKKIVIGVGVLICSSQWALAQGSCQKLFISDYKVESPGTIGGNSSIEIPGLNKLGLSYQINEINYQQKGPKPLRISPSEEYGLRVSVDVKTVEQFNQLKAYYGQGLSQVSYQKNKTYQLTDFLPPLLQALDGLNFLYQPLKIPWMERYIDAGFGDFRRPGVLRGINCYSVVYELIRSRQMSPGDIRFTSFMVGREDMYEVLTSPAISKEIPVDKIQPGDVLLYIHDTGETARGLMHAAYVVDKNLVFELPDSFGDQAIRLAYKIDLDNRYLQGDRLDDRVKAYVKAYRIEGDLKKPEVEFGAMKNQRDVIMHGEWDTHGGGLYHEFYYVNHFSLQAKSSGIYRLNPKHIEEGFFVVRF